ncbi:fungal-specific transcription factor domain-containing protein [Talaromyces proteolyticus]|uniref:Fungal-specific transcription factor domain-containing protein n=1 Tax=Talaromyces proteolyticus TaxID=1131652 RepID=A0AAD4KYP2_9EURO|nr:fungal-specific transcription factor domain-containing protein [Talaromyces proteolyticus]KAH8702228.1 fungal-specific transcription factor domain-containing protein [Talaromyces proteolyticus]
MGEKRKASVTPDACAKTSSYTGISSSTLSVPTNPSVPLKVPIPRQQSNDPPNSDSTSTRQRARRACSECKNSKTKCSGEQPFCERCMTFGLTCVYGPNKQEKMTMELNDLHHRLQIQESLLAEIYPHLDKRLQDKLDGSQWGLGEKLNYTAQGDPSSSPGIADYTDEDYNREELSQATGHVGQYSDRSWILSLKKHLGKSSTSTRSDTSSDSIASVSYLLDDLHISIKDDINPLNRPARHTADRLMSIYFRLVHPSFPILSKTVFSQQYTRYYNENDTIPQKKWRAILNLVFAIAAKHSRRNSENFVTDDTHLEFFSRAWMLGMGGNTLLLNPDLQQVQIEGLISFYLLTVEQANRSWRLYGLAINSAYAMGLHMRSESKDISPTSKEIRYRVWWSLYTFETTLCIITGRPVSATNKFCSTPLPIPFPEEDFQGPHATSLLNNNALRVCCLAILGFSLGDSDCQEPNRGSAKNSTCESAARIAASTMPNISLYFTQFITLTANMRKTLHTLYALGNAQNSWTQNEAQMHVLDTEANVWYSKLPVEFRFMEDNSSPLFERQRVSLAFLFYSAKIIYSWPALHRFQALNNENASTSLHIFATLCVNSACDMLDVLPEKPDMRWINETSPWWCVLHYLMQATAVLLLKMSVQLKDGNEDINKTAIIRLKKSLDWLQNMSSHSEAAERAWNLSNKLHGQLLSQDPIEIPDPLLSQFLLGDDFPIMT